MQPLPFDSQVEQTQGVLSTLLCESANLSPERQELIASEMARFAKRIDSLCSKDGQPSENEARVLRPDELEEERRLGMARRGAHAGIWVGDVKQNISTWSPGLRDLLAVGPDEPSSVEKFIAMIHPDDQPSVEAYLQATLQTRAALYLEFRMIRGDGQIIWLNSVGYIEHDSDGAPSLITGINQDISD